MFICRKFIQNKLFMEMQGNQENQGIGNITYIMPSIRKRRKDKSKINSPQYRWQEAGDNIFDQQYQIENYNQQIASYKYENEKDTNGPTSKLFKSVKKVEIQKKSMDNKKIQKQEVIQSNKSDGMMEKIQNVGVIGISTKETLIKNCNIVAQILLLITISLNGFIPLQTTFSNPQPSLFEWIELALYICFIFLLLSKIIILFHKDPKNEDSPQIKQWLFILMDFITIFCGIFSIFIIPYTIKKYFKALRCLKLLYLFKDISSFNKYLSNFLIPLCNNCYFLIPGVFLVYIYAIVGLYYFSGLEYNKCRDPINLKYSQNWTVYEQSVFLCGNMECPVINSIQYQCLNPLQYSVEPNQEQLMNIVQGYGLLQYSNIFYSLLSTLKQTFITGSSRLIILYKQAVDTVFVQFYFFTYIYFMSYIYMNIFYGIIIINSLDEAHESKETNIDELDRLTITSMKKNLRKKTILSHKKKNSELYMEEQTNSNLIMRSNVSKQQQIKFDKPHNKSKQNVDEQISEIQIQYPEKNKKPPMIPQKEQTSKTQIKPENPSTSIAGNIIVQIFIIASSLNLCMYYHGISQQHEYLIFLLDYFFLIFFVLEISVRFIVETCSKTLAPTTIANIIIYLICIGGVIFDLVTNQTEDINNLIVPKTPVAKLLRTVKYLRMFTLLMECPYFTEMKIIVQAICKSLYSMRYMVVLWWLVIYILSAIGYQLFHPYEEENIAKSINLQISYNGFYQSIIFTILTVFNEEWDYLMFQQYQQNGAIIVIWQLITLVVGLMLISKYFMAQLVKELEQIVSYGQQDQCSSDCDPSSSQLITDRKNIENEVSKGTLGSEHSKKPRIERIDSNKYDITNKNAIIPITVNNETLPIVTMPHKLLRVHRKRLPKINTELLGQKSRKTLQIQKHSQIQYPHIPEIKASIHNIDEQSKQEQVQEQQTIGCPQRLAACFKQKVKTKIQFVIQSRAYMIIKIAFVIAQIVLLSLSHSALVEGSQHRRTLVILLKTANFFFFLDLVANLIVYPLYDKNDPNSYLRKSYYNWLNIIICTIEFIGFSEVFYNFFIYRKLFRVLSSLRIFCIVDLRYHANWNMRITVQATLKLIPKIFGLLSINMVLYLYFSLILLFLYKDELYSCEGYETNAQITNKWDCMNWGGNWIQQPLNYSTIIDSFVLLFFVATSEGWLYIMQPTMNLNGVNQQPKFNANEHIQIFFVIFFFIGNMIVLNTFISLSIWNFKKLKDRVTGENFLKPHERLWLRMKSQIGHLEPKKQAKSPQNKMRRLCYNIIHHKCYHIYQYVLFVCFLLVCSSYTFEGTLTSNYFEIILRCYAFILMIQYIIKFIGIGPQLSLELLVETFVFLYTLIFFVVANINLQLSEDIMKASRAFLIIFLCIRYLKIIDEIPIVSKLLNTIIVILPKTFNMVLIVVSTFYFYTILGTELFAFLRPGLQINEFDQNYKTFGSAMFSLAKFSLMESPIQQISDAARSHAPNFICFNVWSYDDYLQYGQMGCGSYYLSITYFLSFHIFYSLILLSMLVTLIVDAYSQVKKDEQSYITRYILLRVINLWSNFDPDGTGFIPYREFWRFSAQLLEIYDGKIQKSNIIKLVENKEQFLKNLELPIYINEQEVLCFQFNEVIQALTSAYLLNKRNLKIRKEKTDKMYKQRKSKISIQYKKSNYNSSHVLTLIILKSAIKCWRRKINRKGLGIQLEQMIKKVNNSFHKPPQALPLARKNSIFKDQNRHDVDP